MEMLHYDFMQRAFCAGGMIAILASTLGVYLMLRRQALMADMLSHVSLAGVAAGALIGFNPTLAGFITAVLGAMAVEYVRRSYKSYSEISVAIIMIGGMSIAVVLMSLDKHLTRSFSSYLFGTVVAVNGTELLLLAFVTVAGGLFFFLFRRPLYLLAFDEETARTAGVPVDRLTFAFSILTGMIVAAAMPIVGVLLVSSLIVLPAALANRLSRSFTWAIVLSIAIGLTGVFTGLTASYQLSTPPGGTIALVLLVIWLIGTGIHRGWRHFGKKKTEQAQANMQGSANAEGSWLAPEQPL